METTHCIPASDPFQSIRGTWKDATIAILASGPSVALYDNSEDLAIGVNGASVLLTEGDFFLSDDSAAPSRSWFRGLDNTIITMALTAAAAIRVPAFYPDKSIRGALLEDYNNRVNRWLAHVGQPEGLDCSQYGRTDNLNRPRRSSDGRVYLPPMHPDLNEFEDTLPAHQPPHLILRNRTTCEPISRNQLRLNSEGTSAHVALQLAYIMGAAEIHLYGVEFSNPPSKGQRHTGLNYFYKAPPGEGGMTLPAQLNTMDKTIAAIQRQGTPVYSHVCTNHPQGWNTRLTNSTRLDHRL